MNVLILAGDAPIITNSLTLFFERTGFQVLTVLNGAKMLEKAQPHRLDLIVLDVLTQRLDGREVLRRWERSSHHYFKNITGSRLPQVQSEPHQVIALLRALATDHNCSY
jgi:DNA-binding response OmpR family regulator